MNDPYLRYVRNRFTHSAITFFFTLISELIKRFFFETALKIVILNYDVRVKTLRRETPFF